MNDNFKNQLAAFPRLIRSIGPVGRWIGITPKIEWRWCVMRISNASKNTWNMRIVKPASQRNGATGMKEHSKNRKSMKNG